MAKTAPTFVAAGTAAFTATSGASFTPAMPTGWAVGDILVLVLSTNNNGTFASPSGWTQKLAQNNTSAQRTEVWWKRAVSGQTAPAITLSSNAVSVVRGGR